MNRQRLWVYLALLLLAGLLNLYLASSWLGRRAAAAMDRSLKTGVALVEARAGAVGGEARTAAALRGDAAIDVTLLAGKGKGEVASSTLPNEAARAVAGAATTAGRIVDVGSAGAFTGAPAHRATFVQLDGDAGAVVSVAAAPFVAGLGGYQGSVLLVLLMLLAVGVALGLAGGDGAAAFPRDLLLAAGRISTGDYTARAPRLAGSAGVVADALNRAAEAAVVARRESRTTAYEIPPEPRRDLPAPSEAPAPAALSGGRVEGVPAAPLGAPRAAAPDADEGHWRGVFDEFLRVRGRTGEAGTPVSYDRFRSRLARNREQLVQRYSCRTVRFQVYVKDGKAAVRGTPVR
jgi:hypothetical protein